MRHETDEHGIWRDDDEREAFAASRGMAFALCLTGAVWTVALAALWWWLE
jgi:hypothetical protein